jgi:hypothetical protein
MQPKLNNLAGVIALVLSTGAAAQAQKAVPAQPAIPATKAQTTPTPTMTTQPTAAQPTTAQPTTATPDEPTTGQSSAPGQTQSTPGQLQTTPGQASQLTPAVTGQTPSGQTVPNQAADQAQAQQLTKATAADVKSGVPVYDSKGDLVGKIVSSTAKGGVLDTGKVKATIPLASFAKSDKGLVIGMTKSEVDAAAQPTTTKVTKATKKPK